MAIVTAPQVHTWTLDEYYQMAEVGVFEGKHVELITGQVVDMSPMGSPHMTAVTLTGEVLRQAFGPGYFLRIQGPLTCGLSSAPEPDVAVIAGQIREYTHAHPSTAVLVVEVADTSLAYDRSTKASLYASAGIPEYWIVNLLARCLEVHRQPRGEASQPLGYGYATVTSLRDTESVTPLALPQARLMVAEMLP